MSSSDAWPASASCGSAWRAADARTVRARGRDHAWEPRWSVAPGAPGETRGPGGPEDAREARTLKAGSARPYSPDGARPAPEAAPEPPPVGHGPLQPALRLLHAEEEYRWLPRTDILTFEEIARLVDVFTRLGVRKLRLTGGEPLLRRELPVLLRMLGASLWWRTCADTNGIEWRRTPGAEGGRPAPHHGQPHTLKPTSSGASPADGLASVLAGIEARPRASGAPQARHRRDPRVNDGELDDLLAYGRGVGAERASSSTWTWAGASHWSMADVVSAPRSWHARGAPRAIVPIRRSRARPRIASAWPTAPSSASSRPRRRRSAAPAIAAASRPTDVVPLPVRSGRTDSGAARAGATPRSRGAHPPTWRGARSRAEERLRLASSGRRSCRGQPHLEMQPAG